MSEWNDTKFVRSDLHVYTSSLSYTRELVIVQFHYPILEGI